MQHYEEGQGFVQVTDAPTTHAVRLEVHGFVQYTPKGQVIFLPPEAARLIGLELVAHGLRMQAEQLKHQNRQEDPNVLY